MTWIWKTLDLTRTSDRDEIRRAYARRLKVTNPEDNPDGFQALRQAYEAALRHAQHAEWEEFETPDDDEGLDEDDAGAPLANPEPIDKPPTSAGEFHIDLQARHEVVCRRFGEMLAAKAQSADLREALEEVLRSERLHDLSTFQNTQFWLARALLHTAPTGDALLPRLIEFFGWEQTARRWDSPIEIQRLLERRMAIGSLVDFERRSHPRHRAYMLLKQSPASFSRWRRATLWWREKEVQSFLSYLQANRPVLLEAIDPNSVEFWRLYFSKKRPPIRSIVVRGTVGVSVVLFLALLIGLGENTPVKALEQRIAAEPLDAQAWADLCRLYSRRSEIPDGAMKTCEQAVWLNGASLSALDGRAFIHLREGSGEQALADYERLLKLSPHDARGLYGRGYARRQLGYKGGDQDVADGKASDPDVESAFGEFLRNDTIYIPASAKSPQEAPLPEYRVSVPHGATLTEAEWKQQARLSSYPLPAQLEEVSGGVELRCLISAEGRAHDCIVWTETPQDYGFGEAAIKVVERSRFTPAAIDGEPIVDAPLVIPFSFRFQEPSN